MIKIITEAREELSDIDVIPLHFDVAEHDLPLEQFIETDKSVKSIVDNFNGKFFDGKLKCQLFVTPPQEGTFLETFRLVISGATSAFVCAWTFLDSDIGKAHIKGLTGHLPSYWAEKIGERTRQFLIEESTTAYRNNGKNLKRTKISSRNKKAVSVIMVQVTKGFLKKEMSDLRKIGIPKQQYRSAYGARNKIYKSCIDNQKIKGLGFEITSEFPIRRKDFPKFVVDLPKEKTTDERLLWRVQTKDIKVNSPNWERDGNRKWQAKTGKGKDVWFTNDDDIFWHQVKIKGVHPTTNDNMKVQWAFPAKYRQPTHVAVLKVLSYNGKKISDKLSQEELKETLKDFSLEEYDQGELFDKDG